MSGNKRKYPSESSQAPSTNRPPLDPNTAFATKTALAFKNAYTSQNPSVLLDMFIYFRNNDQSVTYKSTSSALLNMTSDLFTNINSNIAGLPKELNPEAIDKILAYIHGDALIFPKPLHDESLIHKTFIAATYFKQSKLANKLKSYAIENLNMNLDWDDMFNFVKSLPPPLFLHQFPTHIDQLPSMDNPQGAHAMNKPVQPAPVQQQTWRQNVQPTGQPPMPQQNMGGLPTPVQMSGGYQQASSGFQQQGGYPTPVQMSGGYQQASSGFQQQGGYP